MTIPDPPPMPATAAGRLEHTAALYSDERESVAVVTSFVEQGLAAGEPVFIAASLQAALRDALQDFPDVTLLPGGAVSRRPARVVQLLLDRFRAHGASLGGRLRIVSEIDRADVAAPLAWEPWARYEAAVNALYTGFGVSAMCLYDRRVAPEHVVADVLRTHPRLVAPERGVVRNDAFQPPRMFLAGRVAPPVDPLQHGPPASELLDPAPAEARRAVRRATWRSTLSMDAVDNLVFAVSEAMTNGHAHGRPPVVVRTWAAADRVVVAVCDAGRGPEDPFAGLVPSDGDGTHGRGLWLVHQLCDHVVHVRGDDGFQLRATALGAIRDAY